MLWGKYPKWLYMGIVAALQIVRSYFNTNITCLRSNHTCLNAHLYCLNMVQDPHYPWCPHTSWYIPASHPKISLYQHHPQTSLCSISTDLHYKTSLILTPSLIPSFFSWSFLPQAYKLPRWITRPFQFQLLVLHTLLMSDERKGRDTNTRFLSQTHIMDTQTHHIFC